MLAALAKTLAIEFTHCFRRQKALRRLSWTVDFAHARKGTRGAFPSLARKSNRPEGYTFVESDPRPMPV